MFYMKLITAYLEDIPLYFDQILHSACLCGCRKSFHVVMCEAPFMVQYGCHVLEARGRGGCDGIRGGFYTVLSGLVITWGPFCKYFIYHNSDMMESPFWSHLFSNILVATKFCTWHDSCAVVACAKICCDLVAINWITYNKVKLRQIWIVSKEVAVK